ncbi:MAG: hypothetical protein EHM12_08245 [Dehalococcoidia bacterium]|nr:MAG: hypothetical protein EHM12_08245 [Dehalococcoidia bacterium]
MDKTVIEPDLYTNFQRLKDDIFQNMNCVKIGKISSFDKTKQTAEIELLVKVKVSDTEIKDYPMLLDCPVFSLQGGGAYIEMPITSGDNCIVLFNDRDIDNWYQTGNSMIPASKRKHNLSDGIAIVGLNPLTKSLTLDGNKIKINSGNYPLEIVTLLGKIEIASNGNITFNSGTESYLKGNYVVSTLQPVIAALAALVVSPAATPLTRGDLAGVQSAATTLVALLENWKSTQIKGV